MAPGSPPGLGAHRVRKTVPRGPPSPPRAGPPRAGPPSPPRAGRRGSAGGVGAGHHGGEVVGMNERRRRGRPPGEQAPGALEVLGRPELVVDDAVHVAVVLAEVARRILEVPEEV